MMGKGSGESTGTSAGAAVSEVATQAVTEVKERAQGMIDSGKSRLGAQLCDFASALRETGQRLGENEGTPSAAAPYVERAAESLAGAGDYLAQADVKSIVRDVESFARRRPELFIGGAILAGLLLGRFLRSEPDEGETGGYGRDEFGRDGRDGRDEFGGESGYTGIGSAAMGGTMELSDSGDETDIAPPYGGGIGFGQGSAGSAGGLKGGLDPSDSGPISGGFCPPGEVDDGSR